MLVKGGINMRGMMEEGVPAMLGGKPSVVLECIGSDYICRARFSWGLEVIVVVCLELEHADCWRCDGHGVSAVLCCEVRVCFIDLPIIG